MPSAVQRFGIDETGRLGQTEHKLQERLRERKAEIALAGQDYSILSHRAKWSARRGKKNRLRGQKRSVVVVVVVEGRAIEDDFSGVVNDADIDGRAGPDMVHTP